MKRCSYAITQLESQGVIRHDALMFAQEYFYQEEPNIVIFVMTQLSLKAGLKELVDKSHSVYKS